jgi:hypothetical protein
MSDLDGLLRLVVICLVGRQDRVTRTQCIGNAVLQETYIPTKKSISARYGLLRMHASVHWFAMP